MRLYLTYSSLCRRRQIGSEGVICVAWWWDGQGFTAGSLGTHPGLVGTKGTHPSIMILSWSDPVTYQPSFTTRARHLAHPQPDMQVQSASRQFASPLAPLHLLAHQRPGSSTTLPRRDPDTFQGRRDWGLRDTAQNPSRLPNEPLKSRYMLSQHCKNPDKTNCVGSKQQVGGWGEVL